MYLSDYAAGEPFRDDPSAEGVPTGFLFLCLVFASGLFLAVSGNPEFARAFVDGCMGP